MVQARPPSKILWTTPSMWQLWVGQVQALTTKNAVTLWRKPLLLCLALFLPCLAYLTVSNIKFSLDNQKGIAATRKTQLWTQKTALSVPNDAYIFYYPTSSTADAIMKRLSLMTGLKFGERVRGFPDPRTLSRDYFSRAAEISTLPSVAVVRWTTDFAADTVVSYTIMDTSTPYALYDEFDPDNPRLNVQNLKYKVAVDGAILSYARDPSPDIPATFNDVYAPSLNFYRANGTSSDSFNSTSPFSETQVARPNIIDIGNLVLKPILALSFIPIMVLALELVSKEKHKKLIGALRSRLVTVNATQLTSFTRQEVEALGVYKNDVETTAGTCLALVISFGFYCFLAWYLNQVVANTEGFCRPLWFPVTAAYWTGRTRRPHAIPDSDTLSLEKERSLRTDSIRAVKLSKQYGGKTAVREFSTVFETGKLTTVPTFGDCFMFGYDLREDISKLQSLMALCPQFDALYPSLTAYQHLDFYLRFRGEFIGTTEQRSRYILNVLDSVGLKEVAHKRWLDPVSRRKVWNVIQRMKRNRIVVLTTHSMEEADELGDHICVMHQGRLRASGSSIFLKNRFGKGFLFTVGKKRSEDDKPNSQPERKNAIEDYIRNSLPGSDIVASSTGVVVASVSRHRPDLVARFLQSLQKSSELEWSISNSTLEEVIDIDEKILHLLYQVFLKLCTENSKVVEDREGITGGDHSQLCCICDCRKAETVSLYTKSGYKVVVPNFVCSPCAEEDPSNNGGEKADKSRPLESFMEFVKENKGESKPLLGMPESPAHVVEIEDSDEHVKGTDVSGWLQAWHQIAAILFKNFKIHGKELRANVTFVISVIALNAAAALFLPFLTSFSVTERKVIPASALWEFSNKGLLFSELRGWRYEV
ncbi:hypothetical protein HDU96_006626 [Phlyctochytrium bullatum]|nr:hypothetical protein HDU96_006626 [Phlyctochytrium bullatum]